MNKLNQLQIKNIFISVMIFLVTFLFIINRNYNFGPGRLILDNYIYLSDVVVIVMILILNAYLIKTKYLNIININRITKSNIHALLNIIVLAIISVIIVGVFAVISEYIAILTIILQIVFFVLIIVLKYEHDIIKVNIKTITIEYILLALMLVSTVINNEPFSSVLIPMNIVFIIIYDVLLAKDIIKGYQHLSN